jgi:putative transposase
MAVAVSGGTGAVARVIFDPEQGSEYTAHWFRATCQRIGIQQSLGRAGSALANAIIESWPSTLEFELHSLQHFPTRAAPRPASRLRPGSMTTTGIDATRRCR